MKYIVLTILFYPFLVNSQQGADDVFTATSSTTFAWAKKDTIAKRLGIDTMRTNVYTTIALKQPTLSSGSNIKTVNGSSLLGSGDISISGTAAWGSVTGTLSNQTDLQTALNGKQASGSYLVATNNLSDINNATTARQNLGLVIGTNVLAPNGSAASLTSFPTLNQNTTGSAATLTTSRNINGQAFNGSADIITNDALSAYQAGGSPILAETINFPLFSCNTSTALVDNTVRFVAIWLPKAATLTGIRVYVRTLGNYTGDNNNRVGLYTYSGGTLTLVASSTNSASLWTSAANAFQTIAFSSTYAASAGLYFVGLLYNQSAQTTAPTLAGGIALNNVAMATMLGTNSIKFLGTLAAQNDLPSSQVSSGITGVTASYWVALY
jgi:hypothetical protein